MIYCSELWNRVWIKRTLYVLYWYIYIRNRETTRGWRPEEHWQSTNRMLCYINRSRIWVHLLILHFQLQLASDSLCVWDSDANDSSNTVNTANTTIAAIAFIAILCQRFRCLSSDPFMYTIVRQICITAIHSINMFSSHINYETNQCFSMPFNGFQCF